MTFARSLKLKPHIRQPTARHHTLQYQKKWFENAAATDRISKHYEPHQLISPLSCAPRRALYCAQLCKLTADRWLICLLLQQDVNGVACVCQIRLEPRYNSWFVSQTCVSFGAIDVDVLWTSFSCQTRIIWQTFKETCHRHTAVILQIFIKVPNFLTPAAARTWSSPKLYLSVVKKKDSSFC